MLNQTEFNYFLLDVLENSDVATGEKENVVFEKVRLNGNTLTVYMSDGTEFIIVTEKRK